MGSCGCGDFHPFAKLAAPKGYVYAVEFYPGCSDCDTPSGLAVHRFNDREAAYWDIADLPELPMVDFGGGDESWAQCAIPFVKLGRNTISATFDEWWNAVQPPTGEQEADQP